MMGMYKQAKHILVIDDDEGARSVLSEILAQAGYTVDIAIDGQEGILFHQKKSYDLVVTDLGMPDMSGRDVARVIKKDNRDIPIVLITGWGMQLNSQDEGVDDIISKPFDRKNILTQIEKLLTSSKVNFKV
jgi:CheY-like chemotaxis protein